jgi:hypothetical protein
MKHVADNKKILFLYLRNLKKVCLNQFALLSKNSKSLL